MRRLITVLFAWIALLSAGPAVAQAAGTLVSAEPVAAPPPGMQAWRVSYRTRGQDGAPLVVTGMVIAPRAAAPPQQPRPVIAWTHGTWGVVEKCAPSLSDRFFSATPALGEMIGRGYVVVAPDYPGLGTAMPHGFLVGRETARSVLDAVRAARAIPGAAAGSRFAVWGESQGGHAALWTGAEAAGYASDLRLVGTAAAAPATTLVENFRLGSDPNARAMLTAFAIYSWSQRFDAPLSTLLSRPNQGIATRLARNNCINLEGTPRLGTILGVTALRRALQGKDLGKIEPWARIAKANSVSASRVPGPVLIAQSDKDVLVAPAVTRGFAHQLCGAGRRVRYIRMAKTEHGHSARDSATATLDWIDARFAGAPAPSDCRTLAGAR